MAKKVWISIPLVTTSEANDAAVVSFLKGGLKKELEVETTAFITKWMADKSVPFHIDVERSSPERNRVVAPAPQVSPVVVPVVAVAEAGAERGADAAVEQIAEGATVVAEPAGEPAEAVNDEPSSQLNAPGGAGLGRARGRSKRRVPEASEAEK